MILKKCFGGIQKYTYCKKLFLDYINEIPPHGGRELICHAISLHPLSMKNMHRQKICKNINMKTDIALPSCRCVEKQSRNVHFTCLTIADKWTMLKKFVLGVYSITCTAKKYLWSISMKCLPHGVHLPCHVTSPMICAKHFSCK